MSGTEHCPICGATASPSTSPHVVHIHGRDLVIADHRSFCARCGDFFYTPEQEEASRAMVTEALRSLPQALTPASIRRLREAYHVQPEDFGLMVGVPAQVVERWEAGTAAPDETSEPLIRLLQAILGTGDEGLGSGCEGVRD